MSPLSALPSQLLVSVRAEALGQAVPRAGGQGHLEAGKAAWSCAVSVWCFHCAQCPGCGVVAAASVPTLSCGREGGVVSSGGCLRGAMEVLAGRDFLCLEWQAQDCQPTLWCFCSARPAKGCGDPAANPRGGPLGPVISTKSTSPALSLTLLQDSPLETAIGRRKS